MKRIQICIPEGTWLDNLTLDATERMVGELDTEAIVDSFGDCTFWWRSCRYRVNVTIAERLFTEPYEESPCQKARSTTKSLPDKPTQ